jgi:hypothetical protein
MSSNRSPEPRRFEATLVLVLMAVSILWYAVPQLLYSLYPVYDLLRSIGH